MDENSALEKGNHVSRPVGAENLEQPCGIPGCKNTVTGGPERQCCDDCLESEPPAGWTARGSICLNEATDENAKERNGMELNSNTEPTKNSGDASYPLCAVSLVETADEPGREAAMEPVITKICSRCPERGGQPLGKFDAAKHGKYGRAAVCKVCRAKQYREMGIAGGKSRQAKLRAQKEARTASVVADQVACPFPNENEQKCDASPAKEFAAPQPLLIVVDLTDYAGLHTEIKRIAVEEDRTPEAQVRYWLRRHLVLTASVCVDLEKGIGASK